VSTNWKRAAWFVALYAAGIASVALVAWLIRMVLRG